MHIARKGKSKSSFNNLTDKTTIMRILLQDLDAEGIRKQYRIINRYQSEMLDWFGSFERQHTRKLPPGPWSHGCDQKCCCPGFYPKAACPEFHVGGRLG